MRGDGLGEQKFIHHVLCDDRVIEMLSVPQLLLNWEEKDKLAANIKQMRTNFMTSYERGEMKSTLISLIPASFGKINDIMLRHLLKDKNTLDAIKAVRANAKNNHLT